MEWPLLDTLPPEARGQLLSVARRRTFGRGEVVFHRDDPADTVHLIARGRFVVRVTTPLGDTASIVVLSPGDVFGELALLSPAARRSATVAAVEAGETRSLHQLDFGRLREQHPGVDRVLVGILAQQVRRLTEQLVEALYVPVERRVVHRLHELGELYAAAPGPVTVPLTQEVVAELAGTSRATVNKVVRDLEERGVVRLGRGRTTIVDREALAGRARARRGAGGA